MLDRALKIFKSLTNHRNIELWITSMTSLTNKLNRMGPQCGLLSTEYQSKETWLIKTD